MKRFSVTIFISSLALVTGSAMAANSNKGGDIPLTQEISDANTANGSPYYIQSVWQLRGTDLTAFLSQEARC